jgi:hypothetical protein
MPKTNGRPSDDASSAPESGTVRDETSGNQPAHPHERGFTSDAGRKKSQASGNKQSKDDPSQATEER